MSTDHQEAEILFMNIFFFKYFEGNGFKNTQFHVMCFNCN